MLENNCLGFSSIEINSEASYQTCPIEEREWSNKLIQQSVGWANYIFDDYKKIDVLHPKTSLSLSFSGM